MKKWYLIEEARGSFYETELHAETKEEAVEKARCYIDHLTEKERAEQTACIIHANVEAAAEAGESYFDSAYCDEQIDL